ncbi:MAG: NAD-dependent epimerase/dehydratase family protein [Planctomycetota bacterium]
MDGRVVAITGGTGFLGSWVVRGLIERGAEVRALAREGTDDSNLTGLPIERVSGTLEDRGALRELCDGADVAVHLAALVSFRSEDDDASRRINVEGTGAFLDAAQRSSVRRFLHCSSTAAIGITPDGRPADENCAWDLDRFEVAYLTTKREAEELALAADRDGFEVVVVNPTSLFGPGDRRAAGYESVRAIRKKGLPVEPPGGLCTADVRDVATTLLTALERGGAGERYILGGDNLSGREFAAAMVRPFGHRPPRLRVPRPVFPIALGVARVLDRVLPNGTPFPVGVLRLASEKFWFDSSKAERELDYVCRPIEQTMDDAAEWIDQLGTDSGE